MPRKKSKDTKLTPMLIVAVAILAIILVLKGGDVITAYVGYSSWNTTPAIVNTSNPGPTVGNCTVVDEPNDASNVDQVTLYAGQRKRVRLMCTVNDESGGNDFNDTDSNINGTLYYTSAGESWTTDNYQHYQNTSCEIGSIINATANLANCRFDVWWNARNSTDASGTTGWTGRMYAKDNGGNSSATAGSDTFAILPLTALDVCAEIAFGTVSPGSISSEKNCSVNNWGNIQIDIQVNGTDLSLQGTGGQGNIPVGAVKYNCTNGNGDFSDAWNTRMANLTNTASDSDTNCDGFDLPSNTTATSQDPIAPSKNSMWRVRVPYNARGNFGGTIWFIGEPG